jgi:5-methylthioadenosine/S-adenosylhomocysteine deaminase
MTTLGVAGGRVLLPDLTIDRADVLVDQDAGEILAVVDPEDSAGTEERSGNGDLPQPDVTLDATDSLVIPGLINAHTHVAMTLLRGIADDKPLDAWLQEDIWPVEAELTPDDVRAGADLGILEMIKSGTTTFSDMYFHVDRIAEAVEESGIRAVLGHTAITVGKDGDAAAADVERSVEVARELDGAADARISTTIQPHSLTTVNEDALADLADAAEETGLPLHFHANETTDEVEPIVDDHGARPLELADDLGLLGPDSALAHCVHVDETELDLLAERGAGVVHNPASNMKLASGMAPVQAMLDRGISVAIGTDGAASNNDLDVFDELRDAAMIGKLAAADASAVAAEDAVEMATAGGADVLGLDAGRIEAGVAADLAVVDLEAPHLTPPHDLVSHLAYAARGSDVRHTVCDGQVLMEDRTVTTFDEAAVRERATKRAAALVDRAAE